jgi:TolB-like protein/Tfp pilus assembly protein PilF
MGKAHSAQGSVRFGEFEVDLRAGELRKGNIKVKLQKQPFQILEILLEHVGEVVSREELRERIWPADTFVDFDQGLSNAIKRLREALSDSAEKPRFIETIPRRGYRFIGSVGKSPAGAIESIAVLPLENLSRDPEQEYFADGLTEALITNLAKISALHVVSRTSAMQYKGVHKSLREIGRDLGVTGIVEGTVLRSGSQVRISVQLIDASSDSHLWAENYDRDLRDILALQSEVAHAIAKEVRVKLTREEKQQISQVRALDPESYEIYLKGRYHWKRRSRGELAKARQCFEEAIAKDSTYAPAYAGLADCLSLLDWWCFTSTEEGCGKAKQLATKALELDPDLADAHVSLAWVRTFYDYDFASAEVEFKRALELNPSHAQAHSWRGFYLALMGRHEDGCAEIKRANYLDPQSMVNQVLGVALLFGRRFDEAIIQFEQGLDLDSSFSPAHLWGLCNAYTFKSLHERAIDVGKKAVAVSHGATLFMTVLGEAYAAAGRVDEARSVLQQLQQSSRHPYIPPYFVARIHAALGEKEEALRWLEIAYRKRSGHLVGLKTDPRFDDLHSAAGFQDLLRRMNFPAS